MCVGVSLGDVVAVGGDVLLRGFCCCGSHVSSLPESGHKTGSNDTLQYGKIPQKQYQVYMYIMCVTLTTYTRRTDQTDISQLIVQIFMGRCIPGVYDLYAQSHVAGCEPYTLRDLQQDMPLGLDL